MAEAFQNRDMKGSDLTPQEADDLFSPEFTQMAHGFVVGDVLRRSSAIAHAKAQADSEANLGVGLSLVVAKTTNDLTVLRAGNSHTVTLTAHGLGAFGVALWLSQGTAGLITSTEPVDGLKWYLGYVIDTNTIHWDPWSSAVEE